MKNKIAEIHKATKENKATIEAKWRENLVKIEEAAAKCCFVTRIWFWVYVRPKGPRCNFCKKKKTRICCGGKGAGPLGLGPVAHNLSQKGLQGLAPRYGPCCSGIFIKSTR